MYSRQHGDWKKMRENIAPWIPISLFVIWIFLMHFCARMGTGDDIWFSEVAHADDFQLLEWLKGRYMGWSSRTGIEAALMISVLLPQWAWRIFDALVMSCAVICVLNMFVGKKYRGYGYFFTAALFFIVDYRALGTAGWQATTINYLWPMAALLIALYPLAKWIRNEKIEKWEYVIYLFASIFAAFSEQACVILLVVYFGIGLYLIGKGIRPVFLYIQFMIGIAGIMNVVLCPGNAVRNVQETQSWFPDYADFSFLQKVDLGISSTIRFLFLERNIMFILLTVVVAVLIWGKFQNFGLRMLGIMPCAVVCGLNALQIIIGGQHTLFNFASREGVLFAGGLSSWKVMAWYLFLLLLCAVMLVDLFVLAGDRRKGLLLDGMFLIGLMTKAMLGFSATIWASYARTGWFCQIAFVCCILFLLEEWKYQNRKVLLLFAGMFTVLAIICGIHSYTAVFSVAI